MNHPHPDTQLASAVLAFALLVILGALGAQLRGHEAREQRTAYAEVQP